MMSRKHYVELAALLKGERQFLHPTALGTLDSVARQMAAYFWHDNPRFDAARFLTAAGVTK